MSIIERSNPINLQYRVAVVTSASTPLGVIICKTLLKANAFVIGIDSRHKDHSLNSGEGTHFQFLQRDVNDENVPGAVMEMAKKAFYGKDVNVLVNVFEEGKEGDLHGLARLTEVIGKSMEREREGSIVNVIGAVDGAEESKTQSIIDLTNDNASQFQKNTVRCNVIIPEDSGGQHSSNAYENAKLNMQEIMTSRRQAKDIVQGAPKHYAIANLCLFLAGDMSESITGSVVRLDGSYQ